ncbi:cobyrinic acid a,c-diamide synthase [Trebonia sp.]|uniref:cobyrinic acid a,c-diamide synthase n=1 Tax=Trebonia sp. TaxID=2767075 RepID=UPI00261D1628|nr:cobyrinic acid a,c-diamide synthase [Trebonia sp.]
MAAGRGRSRRVSIPGVAELLRPAAPGPVASDERQATGREKHDQKITVYLSAAELLDVEQARLALRRYGFVIDRGRLVREAIAILLADLDARGKDSLVARRVRASLDGGTDGSPVLGPGPNGAPGAPGAPAPNGRAADDAASPLPSLAW